MCNRVVGNFQSHAVRVNSPKLGSVIADHVAQVSLRDVADARESVDCGVIEVARSGSCH
jgi:hypothetical protein